MLGETKSWWVNIFEGSQIFVGSTFLGGQNFGEVNIFWESTFLGDNIFGGQQIFESTFLGV